MQTIKENMEPPKPKVNWRQRVIKYDPNWDLSKVNWIYTWKDPSGLDPTQHYMLADGMIFTIVGFKGSRKTLFGDAVIAANFTDNPELTLGFQSTLLNTNKTIIKLDTEQPETQIRMNQKRMKDALGLRADNLNYEIVSLEGMKFNETLNLIDSMVNDLKDDLGLLWIDSIQDLVKGRDENNVDAASDLFDEMIRWMKGAHRETEMPLMYTQHTNRGGIDAGGRLGSLLDRKMTSQFLTIRDIKTNVTTVMHKFARLGAPIPSFILSNNGKGNWGCYEGVAVEEDLSNVF